jgi:hypothetical protein
MDQILVGLQRAPSILTALLLNPTSNLTAAFLLYGVIVVALLIVLVVAIMFLMGTSDEEAPADRDESEEPVADEAFERIPAGEVYDGREPDDESVRRQPTGPEPAPKKVRTPTPPMSPRARIAASIAAILVLAAAWVATGYTTSDPSVCKGCHWAASQHAQAPAATDPHAKVACVSCHEPGGAFGRFVGDVPARLGHFIDVQSPTAKAGDYGNVTQAACSSCHASALTGVSSNQARGLKVSHQEPLAASATCLAAVAAYNAGMAPCLRCHDSKKASAACVTCHDEKAATAARVRTASFANVQIPEVTCGGCHDEKKQCDWCHGMRMPHTQEFMMYAHSRAGAVDFWYNGGRACGRCHTATRRPCQRCHTALIGRAHGTGSGLAKSHRRAVESACDTCHNQYAYQQNRDFCKGLCHSPAAIANSPR